MTLERMFNICKKLEKLCVESGSFDKKRLPPPSSPQSGANSNKDNVLNPRYKTPKYLHVAALIKKNNIVSVGYNHFINDSRDLPAFSRRSLAASRKPRFRVL